MQKNLLTLIFAASLFLALPSAAGAAPMVEIVDNMEMPAEEVSIKIIDNVLYVNGAAGQMLRIYKVTGVGVMTVKVDGDSKSYSLNLPKGCYIVKIGKVARKISII